MKNTVVDFEMDEDLGGINDQKRSYTHVERKQARSIDYISEKYSDFPTIIEINFPHSVVEVLRGCVNAIERYHPKVIIRIGFFEGVVADVYQYVKENMSEYKIYFRYTVGIPQGLTMLLI